MFGTVCDFNACTLFDLSIFDFMIGYFCLSCVFQVIPVVIKVSLLHIDYSRQEKRGIMMISVTLILLIPVGAS